MKVALAGPVTPADIETAGLFGIEPSSYLTFGRAPKTTLQVDRLTPCPMLGNDGAAQRNLEARLMVGADALIAHGVWPDCVAWAERFGIPVYQC